MEEKNFHFFKFEFTDYDICYYTDNKENELGCIAKVNCHSGNKELQQELGLSLTIKFFKNDSEIPPNVYKEYDQCYKEKEGFFREISLHYSISHFDNIVSILRHEKKPLYIFVGGNKENLRGGLLTTGQIKEKENILKKPFTNYRILSLTE